MEKSRFVLRNTIKSDLGKIKDLYRVFYKTSDNFEYIYNYKHFNSKKNEYFSTVAEYDNEIIGHHSIIEKNCRLLNKRIKVGLCSAAIVNPNYSGIFLKLLMYSINNFHGDILIAFPNDNSEGFYTRLLNFNIVYPNYFRITKMSLIKNSKNIKSTNAGIKMGMNFISHRIEHHPINNYIKIKNGECIVYFKIYKEKEIDLVYSSHFDENYYQIISNLLNEYEAINIIHWDKYFVENLGFKILPHHNKFVYKYFRNFGLNIYPCQMIDSDIY